MQGISLIELKLKLNPNLSGQPEVLFSLFSICSNIKFIELSKDISNGFILDFINRVLCGSFFTLEEVKNSK